MYRITRPINGISLNGNEFLLGDDGEPLEFKTEDEAYKVLEEKLGMTAEQAWDDYGVSVWNMNDVYQK